MLLRVKFGLLLSDIFLWLLGSIFAGFLRFDGLIPVDVFLLLLKFGFLLAMFQILFGILSSLYLSRYRVASVEEAFILTLGAILVAIFGLTFRIAFNYPQVPRSIPLIAGVISLLLMLISRILRRPLIFSSQAQEGSNKQRTLIYGAGLAGRQLAEQMKMNSHQYLCVGFLDDDKSKSNLRIFGVRVYGGIEKLESAIRATDCKILLVAISKINSASLLDLERRCRGLGITLRVIPTAFEIVSGAVRLGDITEVSEENLLGRRPVQPDDTDIAEFIRGKRVLVTGAGGSIGSEIVRQVKRYGPLSLSMLDRDESALLALQLSLDGTGLLLSNDLILADIRDAERVDQIMQDLKPEIVFHAAALKHLTTLERFPDEAHKTNVVGTKNVLVSAQKIGVETFVNISTDKAADPSSVLGRSKLTTERLTAGVPNQSISGRESKFISVRFGNVIGSNGSFIHTFRYQIKHGGPLTITHPDVTRFFMTVSEAVHLVLQSVLVGQHGETLILDMGEPVRIADIAKRMIEVSGRPIEIVYTGLRPGEKLHETLYIASENVGDRKHKFIMHARVEPMQVGEI
jgi:FlaA1/EpsC-like NDP-sugar epimerase